MLIIVFSTVLAISAMYAPQPLLPVFAREFGVGRDAAAFLTTIVFIPVSLAPLVYGYVLQAVSPRRMLRVSALLLAGSELLFSVGNSFPFLLVLRAIQGLLIPAMLTALMTYVSKVSTDATVERRMAAYVAGTILGGFLGRFLSGAVADLFGWRASFLLVAVGMIACFFLLERLKEEDAVVLARPTPRLLLDVLGQGWFLSHYALVFCMFLVFAAVMNFMPFRMTELTGTVSEFRIGAMYTGYVMGIISSLLAVRIGRMLGGPARAMPAGLLVFALATLGLGVGDPRVFFGVMFVFCGSMFFVHATAAGRLNRHAGDKKGVVNGLYVAFYYGGGVVGSSAPGPVYGWGGWNLLVVVLFGVALLALGIAAGLFWHARRETEG